jgi:hypothetical protein
MSVTGLRKRSRSLSRKPPESGPFRPGLLARPELSAHIALQSSRPIRRMFREYPSPNRRPTKVRQASSMSTPGTGAWQAHEPSAQLIQFGTCTARRWQFAFATNPWRHHLRMCFPGDHLRQTTSLDAECGRSRGGQHVPTTDTNQTRRSCFDLSGKRSGAESVSRGAGGRAKLPFPSPHDTLKL